jgi:hypothetical protein
VAEATSIAVEIVKRKPDQVGFAVQPRRATTNFCEEERSLLSAAGLGSNQEAGVKAVKARRWLRIFPTAQNRK